MALINCPECNQEISGQAAKCPKCGYPIKAEQRKEAVAIAINAVGETAVKVKNKVPWKIVLIVVATVFVVVVGGFFIFRDFWAKVFLDEEQYQVYKVYQRFREITGLNGDCNTFALQGPIDEQEHWSVTWLQNYDNIPLYCTMGNMIYTKSAPNISPEANGHYYFITILEDFENSDATIQLLNLCGITPRYMSKTDIMTYNNNENRISIGFDDNGMMDYHLKVYQEILDQKTIKLPSLFT